MAKMEDQTTQKVHRKTLARIKRVNRHMAREGVRLRQCDLIEEAFAYIQKKEVDFMEYVLAKHLEDEGPSDSKSIISDAISKPWFPY